MLKLGGETREEEGRKKAQYSVGSDWVRATDISLRHPAGMEVSRTVWNKLIGKGPAQLIGFKAMCVFGKGEHVKAN